MSAVEHIQSGGMDQGAILRHLNLNPNDVSTQALLLICSRYRLDALLKHVVLIQGRPYITRDGYLHIAHESEQLDGIEIVEEGEDETHWWAKAAVYRKDMARPFAYRGRYPKRGGNKDYGPEMAIKTAEVMALRRAFNVTGAAAADEQWDEPVQPNEADAPSPQTYAGADEAKARELGWANLEELAAEHADYADTAKGLSPEQQARAKARKVELGVPWPMSRDQMDTMAKVLAELASEPPPESSEPEPAGDPNQPPWPDSDGRPF